jgi:GxxExxY protein
MASQVQLRRDDLVYPELSFKLIGCAYELFNQIGFGHLEKIYQKGYSVLLKKENILFKEQVYCPIKIGDEVIGKLFFDLLVDEKVIIELKKDGKFSKQHIDQVNQYLKASKLKLALLINFTQKGVVFKRLVNIN